MPRGKPKRGQYYFKIWLPERGYITFESTRDLTEFEWRSSVLRYLDQLRQIVDPPMVEGVKEPQQ